MSEIVAEYKLNVDKAVGDLNKVAEALKATEAAAKKASDSAADGFLKGSEGAKRLNAELAKQPKTLSELESKLMRLKELLRDDTEIGTKGFKRVSEEIKKTQTAIDGANSSLKATGTSVTGLGSKFLTLGKQIMTALGVVGIIFAIVDGIKSLITTNKDFEFQMAKVKAVTGASNDEFKQLAKNAKDLGAVTKYTATEVGQLQEEFAKLGFSTKEILSATEATLNLAEATGADLAEAAGVAGNVLRGFNLDASETQKVTDIMALSFSKSALNMESFSQAMKYVAPIAKSANIDIQTTTALMGKLADAGLRGSIAGTGLKNLISRLSDANSSLSKEVGFVVKNSTDLLRAFDVLKEKHLDLTQATELTDERSKAAFLTLINGAEGVRDLANELGNATGAAKRMADIMRDTLQGDTDKLAASWEALMLAISSSDIARGAVQLLTDAIDGTTDAIGRARSAMNEYDKEREKTDKGYSLQAQLLRDANALLIDYQDGNIKAALAIDGINKKVKEFNIELNKAKEKGDVGFINLDVTKSDLYEIVDKLKEASKEDLSVITDDDFKSVKELDSALEKLNKTSAENSDITSSQALNIIYYREQIKLLTDQINQATDRASIIPLQAKIIEFEKEIARLLGIETEAQKEAKKAAEEKAKAAQKALDDELKAYQNYMKERAKLEVELNKVINDIEDTLAVTSNQILDRQKQKIKSDYDDKKKIIFDALSEQIIGEEKYNQEIIDADAAMKVELENAEREHQLRIRKLNEETNTEVVEGEDGKNEKIYEMFVASAQALVELNSMITSAIVAGHNQELDSLQQQLDSGQITREEYDRKRRSLERKKAADEKSSALFSAIINTALAVASALTTQPFLPLGPIMAGIAGALGAVQIGVIASQPLPAFAEGVIGLKGAGTETSDSIHAKLSKGESVMTAKETKEHKDVLWAIRNNTFDKLYRPIRPMMNESLLNGWNDLGKSAQLNGLTANLKDHNIIAGLDRLRQSQANGFKYLAKELKSNGRQKRGGYHA